MTRHPFCSVSVKGGGFRVRFCTKDGFFFTMHFRTYNAQIATMEGHAPVLLEECLRLLSAEQGGDFLDATFGGGGHSRALLEAHPQVRLCALDRDPEAAERAKALAAEFGDRFEFYSANFSSLDTLTGTVKDRNFRGLLFDLGVSSFQLDQAERGFSFRMDAPLDMRMDTNSGMTAADFLETAREDELILAIREYGEEVRWKRVVRAIISARGTGRLQRTAVFAELIRDAIGPAAKHSRIHPATLSFQGVRIAVNNELLAITDALPVAFNKLEKGGVLAVISFHSLEDRIVKRFFNRMSGRPEHGRDSTSVMERNPVAELLTRKAIVPSPSEIARNPRSRSAKLRAIRKL